MAEKPKDKPVDKKPVDMPVEKTEVDKPAEPKRNEQLIFKQIPKIMADIKAISKDKINKGYGAGYKFRGIDDVYNALQPLLAKHKVFTVPRIIDRKRVEVTSQKGTAGLHHFVKFQYFFYAEDGSYICADADGEALDYGDKGHGKAASYAHKYALLQVFAIPTDDLDDTDATTPDATKGKTQNNKQVTTKTPPKKTESGTVTETVEQKEARLKALRNKMLKYIGEKDLPLLEIEAKIGKPLETVTEKEIDQVRAICREILKAKAEASQADSSGS